MQTISRKTLIIVLFLTAIPMLSPAQFFGGWGWGGGFGGFGMGMGYFPHQDLSIGKVALSADMDYDGRIDSGASVNVKRNPPGLHIGMRELARVDLSVVHNASRQSTNDSPKLKFSYYKSSVTLDLRPVNLADKRGRFSSFEEEQARGGRVRIWMDENRNELLLDSGDPKRRRVEWPAASSLPPKHVYVEGVTPGDSGTVMMFTLLLDNNNMGPVVDKLFGDKAAWDALMFSVWPKALEKPYVDTSPVWKQLR